MQRQPSVVQVQMPREDHMATSTRFNRPSSTEWGVREQNPTFRHFGRVALSPCRSHLLEMR